MFRRSALTLLLIGLVGPAFGQSPNPKEEVTRLRKEAEAKTKKIGELAQSGALPTNDESIKLLEQLVKELKEIRERLVALEAAIAGAPRSRDAEAASRVRWSGYTQFQYQDTDRLGQSGFDAFRFRRIRLGLEAQLDERLSSRITFDLATGTSGNQAQLRDAWAMYDVSGGSRLGRDRIQLGQMQVPLGYELTRSSADRELPERSTYNRTLFPTERSLGVQVIREGRDGMLRVAAMNALTINDPEQTNLAPGAGNRLAGVAQGRLVHGNASLGLSFFAGERAAFDLDGTILPRADRRFAYLDFEQRSFLSPRFTLRGEAMRGTDRLPRTPGGDRPEQEMSGYHLMGVYQLSSLSRIAFRYEHFDRDLGEPGNALHGYSVSYLHELTPQSRLMLAHEIFLDRAQEDAFAQLGYRMTTVRLQVRF